MRISFSTGTFYHRPLTYSLRLARAVGFDGVELALGLEYLVRGIAPLRTASARSGVPVLSVHPPFLPFPGWPRSPRRAVPRAAAAALAVEAEVCVIHTRFLASEQAPRALAYSAALRAGTATGAGKVAVAVESSQYIHYANRRNRRRYLLDDLATLVRFAEERGCAITLDTGHAGANGEDLLACYEIVKPALRNIHLHDATWRNGEVVTHLMLGEGELALTPLLAALARDGYDGLVTLELAPEVVGWWDTARNERRMAQALAYVRAAVAQGMPATPSAAAGAAGE